MVMWRIFGCAPGCDPRIIVDFETLAGEGWSVNRADAQAPSLKASMVANKIEPLSQKEMRALGSNLVQKPGKLGLANSVSSVQPKIYGMETTARDSPGFVSARPLTKACERNRRARVMGANLPPKVGDSGERG